MSVIEESYSFDSQPSIERHTERRRSIVLQSPDDACGCIEIGLSIHDGTYSIDFLVQRVCPGAAPGETISMAIKEAVRSNIAYFSEEHHGKFIGAGITSTMIKLCPDIASFLWRELDIIVMALNVLETAPVNSDQEPGDEEIFVFGVDEQADSAVRKAIMYFGPQNMPPPSIGFRNKVEVDTGGIIQLVQSLDDYSKTVSPETWKTVLHYASALKKKKVKIAFFSATPQGGGVALMRHALMRYFRLLGIYAQWFIPKPSPAVFRITKTNHNILQGVAAPDARFTAEKQEKYTEWITFNARRYWLSHGGPLAEGGADVVVIDDSQMPGLIPLIKEARPDPSGRGLEVLWERIKLADVFISHPVNGFVPEDIPANMVALMPAATDWLDGLNKTMRDWDLRYYHHKFRIQCHERRMPNLSYPARDYIAQIARFDPSKGIPTVLESYRKLRRLYVEKRPYASPPQLLICGHGAIDDPDASIIFDNTVEHIDQEEFDDIREDIVVMRIGPSDQLLNALLSTAKIVLQLSSREGFEVKVSEALHKGKPVISTRAGGIPLQVFMLLNEERKWKAMSECAKRSVSDEVGTVGNALCWMYLAQKLADGETVRGHEKWVADMAREDAGVAWKEGETRLPRGGLQVSQGHGA
ncbi:hypothetical protein BDD12DRAFT_985298 [Trichophaea hybrida]|nr:hypothetical protein BDD12DRAFT_985298 [Trichophaea hybrida]